MNNFDIAGIDFILLLNLYTDMLTGNDHAPVFEAISKASYTVEDFKDEILRRMGDKND